MLSKIKSLIGNIVSNIIASIILTSLIGFGAPCAVIWTSLKNFSIQTEGKRVPLVNWILLGISLFVALICIIFCIIYIVKRRNRPNFPKIIPEIRYESAKSEMYFKSRESISCTREVEFQIVCEKMDLIKKQFTWTGSDCKGTILEKANGQYTLIDYQRKKPPHGYEIRFDTTKKRGEKVWYITRTDVEDNNHEMKPFLSHLVKSPMDKLEIRVTAPVGLIKNVHFSIFADTMAEIPISKPRRIPVKNIGNLETYSYTVNKPNLLYNYRLSWEFA